MYVKSCCEFRFSELISREIHVILISRREQKHPFPVRRRTKIVSTLITSCGQVKRTYLRVDAMSDVERAIIIMDSPPNNLGSIHLDKNMQIVEGTSYACMVLVDLAVHVIFNAKKKLSYFGGCRLSIDKLSWKSYLLSAYFNAYLLCD